MPIDSKAFPIISFVEVFPELPVIAIIFLALLIRFLDALARSNKLLYTSSTKITSILVFKIFREFFTIIDLAPASIASKTKSWPSNFVPGIARKIFPGLTFLLSIAIELHSQSLSIFLLKRS